MAGRNLGICNHFTETSRPRGHRANGGGHETDIVIRPVSLYSRQPQEAIENDSPMSAQEAASMPLIINHVNLGLRHCKGSVLSPFRHRPGPESGPVYGRDFRNIHSRRGEPTYWGCTVWGLQGYFVSPVVSFFDPLAPRGPSFLTMFSKTKRSCSRDVAGSNILK